ncbi:hypothetical protein AMES_5442 [Amycolatopsis mediterranei S699]|uniref:Uncharacterized protein n=2 Tax=Amycolatopsis mediterranei TaxID=33910 RepID=A0A0H3DAI7_AMYMU|nr:hypothetical protein [Amycolatopsis mediterranei]ADJ47267.1 hypothetical protein AMED_5509 [Amycolatopsis mediterranei U32]AEK44092.1 hypothetical protein RAM_28075 [Amycolatopsis mediterranei S699]AFO78978.1 hypothetical protein AMES_5442 [Amycolatopsis mediterranei S699]AGT86106.1 hypothetical protein B737_5442 [Amycolatopsis mediterranei RB]KDO04771.1 hypothetical protein DV26_41950 [Amycolatopsis mediterranei]
MFRSSDLYFLLCEAGGGEPAVGGEAPVKAILATDQAAEAAGITLAGERRLHGGASLPISGLTDAVPALNPTERRKGKTVIRVRS